MFQLNKSEKKEVVTNCDHLQNLKYSPNLPYAFTEHGAIMVASILNTKKAIEVSIYVVRVFVKVREVLSQHKQLAHKLAQLEKKVGGHDQQIGALISAIRQLMEAPKSKEKRIGFSLKSKY